MNRKLHVAVTNFINIISNKNKFIVQLLFLTLIINCFTASAQTQNYFGTTGTLSGNVWSTNVGGPYTSALNVTGGAIINFGNTTTTVTGASITIAGINATANTTITTIGGTISNFSNGVIPISVSSGILLDFSTNAFTTSATAGYIKNSAGAVALGGGTFGGGFTLNAGTVLLRGVNAMGGGATNTLTLNGGTVAGTATRDLTGKFPNGITIGGNVQFGDVTANFSQIAANNYNLTFSNNISLGAAIRTLTLGNAGTHTLSGVISGTGGITFAANANGTTGTFALTTGNTYSGKTQLTGGIISGSGESIFGANPGAFVADQITFNGGTLSASGNLAFSSNRGITFTGTTSTLNSNANTITLTNICTGTGGFTKTGTGIILLDGAHTFSGPVTVSAGTLRINATGTYPDASALSVSAGATFDLKGLSETIGSLAGAGTVSSSVTGAVTLTTGGDNTSTTFSGIAQNGTATSLSVTKTGTGIFIISGANTYTGITTITNGTLQLGAAERIANTSNMVLNGGTFSTGASTGNSETLGTLNLNANSTIALGTGNHTITFSNSSAVGWAGTTLTITGWTGTAGSSGTGGKIVVGAGGLSGAQLAAISFTGYPGTPIIVAGEVVPPVTVSVPTLITPTVTSITNISATLGATITADGGSAITDRGTSYKTSSPVIATDNQLTEGGTSIAAYSHNRTSLAPQTLYYFVGYASNINGTAISTELSFRTFSNPPSNQAVNLIASATSSSQIDLSWDAAVFPSSGATVKGYVLIRAVNPLVPTLTSGNGTVPTAGVGTIVSSTIIDPTSVFSNTGLSASTTYNYLLVPYCWDGLNATTYNYLTSAAPTATATTPAGAGCTAPTPQASVIVFSSVTSSSMTISWTAGGGGSSLVLVRAAANITATPIDGTAYTASNVFGSGDNLGSFTYACYSNTGNTFSLTSLSASTTYYVSVFAFNNTGNCYNISSPANSSQATTSAASVIETFEPGTKGAYASGNAVCNLGNWNFNDALIGTSASDRKNGAKSCRIQNNGTLTMLFDKANGVGTITVQHALYGADASSTWTLEVSDNSGASFTAYQSANITTSSTTLTAQVFTVNVTGDFIRIRITKLTGGSNRLNIDDIAMTDFISTNTITTSAIAGSPFCISNTTGATVSVPFTSTGSYNSLNVYTAQLSDASGNFSAPTDIGTLSGNANSGTIVSTIPAGTANGSAFRIRVISSDPIVTGNANTSNLSVVLNAPDLTNFYGSVTSGSSVILGWTNPGSCFDEILIIGKATSNVTTSPTGNGSLYTANAAFSTGGSGANLPSNEYAVFKAVSGTSVTVTGLTAGTTYFFKAFTRKGTLWSDGVILSITPLNVATGDFQTISSGTYTTVGIWQTWNGSSWVAASGYPNQAGTDGAVPGTVNVTIKSGHTVTLNASRSNQPIKNLVIENGAKIFTNDSTVNGNRYLTIYGDIFCSGIVGNGYNKYDNISFNMEGVNQTISGTGAFNGSRLRKNFNGNSISNLIIAMNIGLKFNSGVSGASGTEIYSNNGGTTFNMTLNENTNLNLLVSTGTSGNISIDGIDGEGSGERGGTFTINGTLSVPGTLFAFTDNVTSPVAYIIGTSGIINCVNVCTGNTASSTTAVQTGSAAGGCTLRILNGGKLNLTGGSSTDLNTYNKPFSKRSNTTSPYTYVTGLGTNNTTYDFQTGSTVEYSSVTGTEPVQSQTLIYSNLLITGGATKTINSTLDVNKDLTIQSPALFDCVNNN
ncbi:MAG: autotransporter-associated beta strand repeat-containing protein, partial [Bacteroidota bacterium]